MVAQLTYLTVMLSYCMLTEHKETKHHSVVGEVKVEKEVKRTKQGEREARRQGNNSVQNSGL